MLGLQQGRADECHCVKHLFTEVSVVARSGRQETVAVRLKRKSDPGL